MENSKIEWTHHTWNPWIGCTKVSPGCHHCYAETLMDKRYGKVKWGLQGKRVRTSAAYWRQPYKWNREAEAAGERRRVFCASLADVFEDKPDQPEMKKWRSDLFDLISATPGLDWLLLTKRPENVKPMLIEAGRGFQPLPPWAWIGTSVENQEYTDKRIPELLKIPAVVRFLSIEPMLGPIDLSGRTVNGVWIDQEYADIDHELSEIVEQEGWPIQWVIVGGESGPNARPMHPDWARSIRDQCQEAGVPFFFKQWGEWLPYQYVEDFGGWRTPDLKYHTNLPNNPACYKESPGWNTSNSHCFYQRVGKARAGRLLDGQEWNEFPQVAAPVIAR
jgi:protein gp37